MQFVARNVAKVELDSTSATVACKSCTVCPSLDWPEQSIRVRALIGQSNQFGLGFTTLN